MIAGFVLAEPLPLLEPLDAAGCEHEREADEHRPERAAAEPQSCLPHGCGPFRRVAARVGGRADVRRWPPLPARPPRSGGRCSGAMPGFGLGALRPLRVRVLAHAQSPRNDEVLHEREGQLDRDGEERDQQGTGEESLVVVDARAVVDVPAQAAPPDDRSERRRRHHGDRRRPDAGHDQRGRQRHLHAAEQLAAAHAHAARRVDRLGVDAGHPGVRVRDHRRDRQGDEHEEGRDRPDADRLHPLRRIADAEPAHREQQQREGAAARVRRSRR